MSTPRPHEKCFVKKCPMTMGFHIGGGLHVCWFHALVTRGLYEVVKGQEYVALSRGTK